MHQTFEKCQLFSTTIAVCLTTTLLPLSQATHLPHRWEVGKQTLKKAKYLLCVECTRTAGVINRVTEDSVYIAVPQTILLVDGFLDQCAYLIALVCRWPDDLVPQVWNLVKAKYCDDDHVAFCVHFLYNNFKAVCRTAAKCYSCW